MQTLSVWDKLSPPQQEAIRLYAEEKGRNWKSKLSDEWLVARYVWKHPDKSHLLQQVRNSFGPSWLRSVQIPKEDDDSDRYCILATIVGFRLAEWKGEEIIISPDSPVFITVWDAAKFAFVARNIQLKEFAVWCQTTEGIKRMDTIRRTVQQPDTPTQYNW